MSSDMSDSTVSFQNDRATVRVSPFRRVTFPASDCLVVVNKFQTKAGTPCSVINSSFCGLALGDVLALVKIGAATINDYPIGSKSLGLFFL